MLINPSSLYSGGNVRFDNTPYLRMAMMQRQKKQALDEASTQYFTKLAEKLNPAGARLQDMQDPNGNGGIQTDIDKWQEKWNLNKDAIKKGGIAQQEFMSDYQRIKQRIDESKNRVKTQAQMGKYAMGGQWRPRSADHPVIEAMDLSIYDPRSKKEDGVSEWGLNDLSLATKPYTPDYQMKHDKVISSEIEPDRLPTDTGIFNKDAMTVTYHLGYTPEKVKKIVQNGLATLKSDKTMYYAMEDALQDDKQVEIASKFLQEDYDRTHKDGQKVVVDTPEEMYAGLQMAKFSTASVPKTYNDKASINEYNAAEWDRRNSKRNAFAREMFNKREAGKDKRLKAMLDYEVNDPYETVEKNKVTIPLPDGTQKELFSLEGLSDAERVDMLGKGEEKYGQKYKTKVIELGGKEYLAKDEYGNLVSEDGVPVDRDQALASKVKRIGPLKKKQAGGEVKTGGGTPKKSPAKKDPLGLF